MTEDTYVAAIHDALSGLKAEFEGEPSVAESLGVIAAQLVVNGDLLKRILIELQTANATANRGRA